jgi:dTDP-4-dehydrorhamnose reductase
VILVFGGNSQLGQELRRVASARDIALVALARTEVDIADPAAVGRALAKYNPELVVNAAAYTKVDLAEIAVEQARHGNEIGPAVLADICVAAELPLVHISTDYVFDGTKSSAYIESDPTCPINIYGQTKAAGEEAIRRRLLHHVILRTGWLYGEFGQNFLKTIVRLASSRDELRVVSDQRGSPTSTRTLADAILRIAPRLLTDENIWGTYHFAGTGVTSWHEFASHIVAAQAPLTGRRPVVKAITSAEYPSPARRPANSMLDCSRFIQAFGFRGDRWSEEAATVTRAVVKAQPRPVTHVA